MIDEQMKPVAVPKLPFWLGDGLLLAILLFFLTQANEPMRPSELLLALLIVIIGFFLTLTPFILEFLSQQTHAKYFHARAAESLWEVTTRIDRFLERIKSMEDAAAKSILIARQVPDRIDDKLAALLEAFEERENRESEKLREENTRLRTLDAQQLEEFVKTLNRSLSEISGVADRLQANADLQAISASLSRFEAVLQELESTSDEATVAQRKLSKRPSPERKASNSSRREARTDVTPEAKNGDAADLNDMVQPPKVAVVPEPDEKPVDDQNASNEETPPDSASDIPAQEAIATTDGNESASAEPAEQSGAEPSRHAKRRKKNDGSGQDEAPLQREIWEPGSDSTDAVLVADALIGLSNKLYVRGDPPLSWDQGTPMDPIGIGKWRLAIKCGVTPLKCTIHLNDKASAKEGLIELRRGSEVKAKPSFA